MGLYFSYRTVACFFDPTTFWALKSNVDWLIKCPLKQFQRHAMNCERQTFLVASIFDLNNDLSWQEKYIEIPQKQMHWDLDDLDAGSSTTR